MSITYKLSKVISYINENKYWERCYVLLKILFPVLMDIILADRNQEEMYMVYY